MRSRENGLFRVTKATAKPTRFIRLRLKRTVCHVPRFHLVTIFDDYWKNRINTIQFTEFFREIKQCLYSNIYVLENFNLIEKRIKNVREIYLCDADFCISIYNSDHFRKKYDKNIFFKYHLKQILHNYRNIFYYYKKQR